jgi:protein-S-isoprenylcysteine O-methyltransferase Ste14
MQINKKSLLFQNLSLFVMFALALFLPAGTVFWLAGWIYLVLFFSFYLAINAWLFRHNPGLLQERMSLARPDQKRWDKFLFPVLLIFPFAWLVFISFDAVRFHWSPVPAWVQDSGTLVLLCSFFLFFLTFRENSFLSTVVRIQQEREHTVVSTGPYHYVRHPMYAAFLLCMIGTPLLLGSLYGVLLGLAFMMVLARRAILEESTLRKELRGYADYMTQVKYRLIPYIW